MVVDNATGHYMQRGQIQMVIVGSDRIAANGDVANKIGTFSSAVVAHHLGIPFFVAAPTTTIDPDCPSGHEIPIEERSQDEVLWVDGETKDGNLETVNIAAPGAKALNPAFDVTPGHLVSGLITESGIYPATVSGIRDALTQASRAD